LNVCAPRASDGTTARSLIESIRARIEPLAGVELELPKREAIRSVPGLEP
jgi:hypothetical protein